MEIKLKLKIKDVEIELTMEEMKKLKELLNELTGREVIEEKEYIPYYPYRYNDWWYYEQPYKWYSPWTILCDNKTDNNITYTATLT